MCLQHAQICNTSQCHATGASLCKLKYWSHAPLIFTWQPHSHLILLQQGQFEQNGHFFLQLRHNLFLQDTEQVTSKALTNPLGKGPHFNPQLKESQGHPLKTLENDSHGRPYWSQGISGYSMCFSEHASCVTHRGSL